tara:strand:+ start:244 stop:360 length:117 start_codon:yes stop_codon:yes gene_type:complete
MIKKLILFVSSNKDLNKLDAKIWIQKILLEKKLHKKNI